MLDPDELRARYDADGFVIIRQLFPVEEIEELKEHIKEQEQQLVVAK